MSRKPFTVSGPTAPKPAPSTGTGQVAAAARDKASAEGITLQEAGAEVMTPDGENGGLQEGPSEDGARPVYAPAIPWGPAKPPAHKPFKI